MIEEILTSGKLPCTIGFVTVLGEIHLTCLGSRAAGSKADKPEKLSENS